ncbi:radical SAM protein [Bradyrhizobium ganzhouense]|uniref:radical SAM protein n=1 Tax=Bradyrhizobium ganzhouense TaxID=1179767 RepID=UPI003CEA7A30
MSNLRPAPSSLPENLRAVVDYRKSGLSLNHVVGCPLDCGYCVRHLFGNFGMKQPHLVMDDIAAVDQLVGHWAFRPHTTPLQIFNRATDPFLPGVKDHLFATLEELDRRGLRNPVLVITRWKIEPDDVSRLDRLNHVRLTILVTWSGIDDDRIEPVASSIAERSMQVLKATAQRTKTILYWRPVIAALNDSDEHLERARELSFLTDATVFTGLFHRQEMKDYFRQAGVPDLYPSVARRKILPALTERRIIDALAGRPLFRKTSCGVAYAHRTADYNGHFGIREICDICPTEQFARCEASHRTPELTEIEGLAQTARLDRTRIEVNEQRIEVEGSTEQQRYFMQHSLNYQVHDRSSPHFYGRHGRAEVGWD